FAGARTTTVNVSELPVAIDAAAVSVTVPPDCPNVKASAPPVCVMETNVAPAGRVSVSTTPADGFGPLFVTVTVYVAVVPEVTDDGPVTATATSAELAGALGRKFATAVPQFAVDCVLAN